MSQLQAILKYQEIDKQLYMVERGIATCDERKQYHRLKKYMDMAIIKLDSYNEKSVQLKNAAEKLDDDYKKMQDTLKDFTNMEELVENEGANIAFYRKKALSKMDFLKKTSNDINRLSEEIKNVHEEYQKLKKEVMKKQEEYGEALKKYKVVKDSKKQEMLKIEHELDELKKDIDPDLIEKYNNKRKEHIFPVLCAHDKEKEQNRCPGCGMEFAISLLGDLSNGKLIECESCHRIIYEINK